MFPWLGVQPGIICLWRWPWNPMCAEISVGHPARILGLSPTHRKTINYINSIMAEHRADNSISVPSTLDHLIHLNVEYKVLICMKLLCRKAVSPAGLVEHLRKIHKEKPEIRKQVRVYVEGCPISYNWSTIPLPLDGLAPQPVIPIVDGLECKHCRYHTIDRGNIKKHGNQKHSMKR